MLGFSPLHFAVKSQNEDCVRLLLQAGADVNCKSRDNTTPLHLAARSGNHDQIVWHKKRGDTATVGGVPLSRISTYPKKKQKGFT